MSVKGELSHVGDEVWQKRPDSANDTCKRRQVPVPHALHHPPTPTVRANRTRRCGPSGRWIDQLGIEQVGEHEAVALDDLAAAV
jgi:hypothetical protein